jgi:hypothetical protein
MGKSKQNIHEINADNGHNKERGGSASIYVGQWDSIKEKMIWGVMEKDKETFVNEGGFFKATCRAEYENENMHGESKEHGGKVLGSSGKWARLRVQLAMILSDEKAVVVVQSRLLE